MIYLHPVEKKKEKRKKIEQTGAKFPIGCSFSLSKHGKMKKNVIILLVLASIFSLTACKSAPKVEEIYDRVAELTEASYELNTVFFGNGLPVLDRENPAYEGIYNDFGLTQYTDTYDIVSPDAKYHSEEEIRSAAEKVYSEKLLKDVLFVNAFDGRIVADGGEAVVSEARFTSDGTHFYQLRDVKATPAKPLIFDYATMKIVNPSDSKRVKIVMNAWEEENPESVFEYRLDLIFENGAWMLDSLTV